MKDIPPPPALRLGWEEWVALPALGLPALRVKIDTGARTAALHATRIEPFGPAGKPRLRFDIHPIPGRHDVRVACAAPVIDRREITSSSGEREWRFVIRTDLAAAGLSWPVEVSLTDRSGMAYRMLIGRTAIPPGASVEPGGRFLLPVLDYGAYSPAPPPEPPAALRIAILSREAASYSTRRLAAEGADRGHHVDVIDTARVYLGLDARAPALYCDGRPLPHYDAVIPRIGASMTAYGAAVLRQFAARGTALLNPPEGIAAARDKLHAHQIMARARVPMPATAFAASPHDTDALIALAGGAPLVVKLLESTQGKGVVLAETRKAAQSVISAFRGLRANFLVQSFVAEAEGADLRVLVVDGKVAGAMCRRAGAGEFRANLHLGGSAEHIRLSPAERAIALRAARAFGLGLAGVDMLRSAEGPKVLEVNASPGLEGIERATGRNLAAAIIAAAERIAAVRAVG